MNRTNFMFKLLAFFAFSLALTSAAHALPRTYVSMSGNDANTCAFNAPCRTFAGALPKTDASGAITALETGSYGIVTINKALSIIAAPGVHAEVAPGGNSSAITVQLGGTTGVVVLRNLYLVGASGLAKGVDFKSGGSLHVENCSISGFDRGVNVTAAPSLTYVKDTTIRNVHDGVYLVPTAANTALVAQAFIEHCRFENYFQGAVAAGRYTTMTVRDSSFTGRSKDNTITYGGIIAAPTSVGTTHIMVENCLLSNNYLAIGTKTDGVAFISISQNVLYHNQIGVFTCCLSKMITFGNNRFEDNNDDGSFNLSTPLK
ncbi:MAG: right-handed parallel beta-helix repeat-containing protein [Pyrinomonadaceae bacterium]